MTKTGWFADLSDEEDRHESAPWQAFLQVPGACFPFDGIWFRSEQDCLDFIKSDIIGQGMLEGTA